MQHKTFLQFTLALLIQNLQPEHDKVNEISHFNTCIGSLSVPLLLVDYGSWAQQSVLCLNMLSTLDVVYCSLPSVINK